MFCQKCGNKQPEGSEFCHNCGAKLNNQVDNKQLENLKRNPANTVSNDKKNKGCLKPILIIIGVIVALFIAIGAMGSDSSSDEKSNSETTKQLTDEEIEANKKAEEAQKIQQLEDFKSECGYLSYQDLSRNPDNYIGQKVILTGEVIQVLEEGNDVDLRLNITKGEYFYTDTVYVTYSRREGQSRILEGDIVTIWGTYNGLISYKSVSGTEITIPQIDAVDVEFFNSSNQNSIQSTTQTQSNSTSSTETNVTVNQTTDDSVISLTYEGDIGTYPIHMFVDFMGELVSGTYYYDEYGTDIPFSGSFDGVNVELYVDTPEMQEAFIGVLEGDEIYGTWYSGNTELEFSVLNYY